MKGKTNFTVEEYHEIIQLINEKLNADSSKQKNIRAKIRKIGFYFSDFYSIKETEFNVESFEALISNGDITISKS